MDKNRFSLWLLEPNEIYFEDFAVDLKNDLTTSCEDDLIGRLKICSKSLVFESKNPRLPLIKLRYSDCEEVSASVNADEKTQICLIVRCTQYIEMLENNIIAPYTFKRQKRNFLFHFYYVDINDVVLQLCQQLHRAASLHNMEQNDMISTIVFSKHNRLKFNTLWLDNIYEEILFDTKVDEIHPLVLNPGRILLTISCIYFQPYNNIQPYPVIKIKLSCISNYIKRRFLLRHTGLEIMWNDNSKSMYISFRNTKERHTFCSLMEKQHDFDVIEVEPDNMTLKWQNGLITNFDYLLYLNSLADRTFKDLTQYPVFPWIITDYNSEELDLTDSSIYRDLKKPIGALNAKRLSQLKERYDEMTDTKYLYGSHYSTPGFVLFYLVRKFPHLMLCLQNGRFDHPDRMFNSVHETFQNCLSNMSDFKELIPEFYDTSSGGDFLLNIHKINFGSRSDGTPVNHVTLPPWAKNSPEKFIHVLRDALESTYVSSNLHNWIDIIFGYKQRGEEAEKADNVFYHLCYEGAIDLDDVKSSSARHALEVQISEFGQIPKQLFTKPHVARKLRPEDFNSPLFQSPSSIDCNKFNKMYLRTSYVAHKDIITSICLDGDVIISTGKDGVLKYFNLSQERQISASLSDFPLSSCFKIPNSNIYILSSWDNTILMYNFNYGKVSDIIPAHDDTVSCLNFMDDVGILISGSWDCSVKVWRGFNHAGYRTFTLSNSMIAYISLEDKVTCLASKRTDEKIEIYIGTHSGEVIAWHVDNITTPNLTNSADEEKNLLFKHDAEVTGLEFNKTGCHLASCSADGFLVVMDTVTGMPLFKKKMDYSPTCLSWFGELDYLFAVDTSGYLSIWNLVQGDLKMFKMVSKGPLSCVKYSAEHNILVIGGRDEGCFKIKCWSLS